MATIEEFIQKGGYFQQEGGVYTSVKKIFDNLLISDNGIYDRTTYNLIDVQSPINEDLVGKHIIIDNVITQKFNFGIDRILYGDIEECDPVYNITITFMDFKESFYIETQESMKNIVGNYLKVISFLNKTYKFKHPTQKISVPQTVMVSA